jgi:hypothetical protein
MKYTQLRPIDTAPTDGTIVRLFGPKGTVMGRWLDGEWRAVPRMYRITPPPTRWLPADVKAQPKRPCRNHPHKWAQDRGGICRACLRAAGDTRTTRQIQADERRPPARRAA